MSNKCPPDALDHLSWLIADGYSSIYPATSATLSSYLSTSTARCFSSALSTVSFFFSCVSFTLFRRQWLAYFRTHNSFRQALPVTPSTSLSNRHSTLMLLIHLFYIFLCQIFALCRSYPKKPLLELPHLICIPLLTATLTPLLTLSFLKTPFPTLPTVFTVKSLLQSIKNLPRSSLDQKR